MMKFIFFVSAFTLANVELCLIKLVKKFNLKCVSNLLASFIAYKLNISIKLYASLIK